MSTVPRVLLHDHLDGGLRPATVADLATTTGHTLPAPATHLADWFDQGRSGSLERYLLAFEHTLAVMQTSAALERVAEESVNDLAADGVVYAELRVAPLPCTRNGLSGDEVVAAITRGMRRAGDATGLRWGLIIDAMRNEPGSLAVAELAVRHADSGVVGFDLAGPEAGFPPDEHLDALDLILSSGLNLTIHAGEAAGPESIEAALRCGAQRIGHGVEIIADCRVDDGAIVDLGPVAQAIFDRRIPLELCVYSNMHTKAWRAEAHPIGLLHRSGFNVTINTDNRLMSRTSMSREIAVLQEVHGFSDADVATLTMNALDAAFCTTEVREELRPLLSRELEADASPQL